MSKKHHESKARVASARAARKMAKRRPQSNILVRNPNGKLKPGHHCRALNGSANHFTIQAKPSIPKGGY